MKTIQEQFNEITLIKVFEIAVIDKRTNKEEYIVFNIDINGNTLKATHEALNKVEQESNKIAFKSIEIDDTFSLNHHLEELYSECINAIIESDFFELLND